MFFYLATPYTKYEGGLHQAWVMACRVAGELIKAGLPVFSPIAHSHPIAVYGDVDAADHGIWLPADQPMMAAAAALVVYRGPGWQDSFGVAAEIHTFQRAGKPVLHLNPGLLCARFLAEARGVLTPAVTA